MEIRGIGSLNLELEDTLELEQFWIIAPEIQGLQENVTQGCSGNGGA